VLDNQPRTRSGVTSSRTAARLVEVAVRRPAAGEVVVPPCPNSRPTRSGAALGTGAWSSCLAALAAATHRPSRSCTREFAAQARAGCGDHEFIEQKAPDAGPAGWGWTSA
jgi:hypothetical protein